MFPAPNPDVLAEVAGADAVVYAMGSLYTSICPSLVLQVNHSPRLYPRRLRHLKAANVCRRASPLRC